MKLCSSSQRSFHLLPFLCHAVVANTEIINFSSSRERAVDLPLDVVGNGSTLRAADNERQWSLEPAALHAPLHQVCDEPVAPPQTPFSCPHELWLLLDLDDEKWASYSTFTLRLSWPASTPAEFTMALYSPQDLVARLTERGVISTARGEDAHLQDPHSSPRISSSAPHTPVTRSRYARIRAVDAGIPTPGLRSHPSLLPTSVSPQPQPRVPVPHPGNDGPASSAAVDKRGKDGVSFVVILEPLHLGVLPATLLPTVGFLIPIVLAAALSVPWVTAYFDPFVRQAREDLSAGITRMRKER